MNLQWEVRKSKIAFTLLVMGAFLVLTTGCSTHRAYKETTTTTTEPASAAQTSTSGQTTTTVTEQSSEHTSSGQSYGLIGGTVHLLGQILAFPFRVIAGLFEAVF